MMNNRYWLMLIVMILAISAPVTAKVVIVNQDGSGDYTNLAEAKGGAEDGDMVIVADGIYTGADNRSLMFTGKSLFFTSENGPDNCIIDLESSGRAAFFWGDQDSSTVFQGFTIRNGHVADGGGALLCGSGASPKIINNIIIDCHSDGTGGGICINSGRPLIFHNTLSGNSALNGGGIYIRDNSEAHISDNIFYDNTAVEYGGGIHIASGSTPLVNNCLFDSNGAEMTGGAVYSSSTAYGVRLFSCTFDGNWVEDPLGGAVIRNPSGTHVIMTNSIVYQNSGVPYIRGGTYTINYCFIYYTGWPSGSGNIGEPPHTSPGFTTGPGGDFYLLQPYLSVCVGSGSDDASAITVHTSDGPVSQQLRTTSIDEAQDTDRVDMGYHYTHYLQKFVPDNFGTIQAAIDASLYGDTITVRAGTWTENVDFGSKTSILKSEDGPDVTTIAGSVSMNDQVQWPATLFGFTITGAGNSSAIDINNASCPLVEGNWIVGNNSYNTMGAGISIYYGNCIIRNNVLMLNHTDQYGGGILVTYYAEPLIEGNLFADNSASVGGGGISVRVAATPTLRRNTFVGNSAYSGGAMHLYNTFDPITVEQCTVVDNEGNLGAGIYCGGVIVDIDNSIIAFNNVGAAFYCYATPNITLTCTDIYGNYGGDWVACIADQYGSNGNINEDPIFCDAAARDFHLEEFSPCTEGNSPCGQIGAFGVGCSQTTLYLVYPDGSGYWPTITEAVNMASSGDTIMLADGEFIGEGNRDVSLQGKHLFICSQSGIRENCTINCSGSYATRNRAFVVDTPGGVGTIMQSITINNGYSYPDGGGAIMVTAGSYLTLVDCLIHDCVGDNYGGAIHCEGAMHVMGSRFNNNSSTGDGGAIDFRGSNCTISACEFFDNSSAVDGGAVNAESCLTLTVSDSEFDHNRANSPHGGMSGRGGAIMLQYASTACDITDCVFTNNFALNSWGGALYFSDTLTEIVDCSFSNSQSSFGGAVYLEAGPGFDMIRCSFESNWADWHGGAFHIGEAGCNVEECLFANNRCENGYGGAAHVEDCWDDVEFLGCTFYGNDSSDNGGSSITVIDAHVRVENSLLSFGYGEAFHCSYADIELLCTDIFGNAGGDWTGDIAGQLGVNGNICADPYFCDAIGGDLTLDAVSECLPGNNSCDVQMGLYGEGCAVVSVEDEPIPAASYLAQNNPNPFNPTTEISFGLAADSKVDLHVFDVVGRCVRTLVDAETLVAGHHSRTWRGRDDRGHRLSSGVYFYRLEADNYTETFKMVLLK